MKGKIINSQKNVENGKMLRFIFIGEAKKINLSIFPFSTFFWLFFNSLHFLAFGTFARLG
jgi:hypothetical protein